MEEPGGDEAHGTEGTCWGQESEDGVDSGKDEQRKENGNREGVEADDKDLGHGADTSDSSTTDVWAKQGEGSKNTGTCFCVESEEELPVKENEIEEVRFDYLKGSFVRVDTEVRQKGAYLDAECVPKAVSRQGKKDGSRARPRLKVDAQIWTDDAHRGCKTVSIRARGSELCSKGIQATRNEVENFLGGDKDVILKTGEGGMAAMSRRESILEYGRENFPDYEQSEMHSSRTSKMELVKAEMLLGRVLFQNADVEAFHDFLVRIISLTGYCTTYAFIAVCTWY